jgi:hypothetical protein
MGPAPCRPATKAPPTMSRRKPSSSAATSKVCGTVTPSALAVLRLITSSNLVGCWTGRSPGLSPFRIRSTYAADPGYFSSLYGKLIPFDVNQKTETKTVVRYETVEERRQAMIAKGWSPAVLAALEEAMEPKFLRDMREENEGQGEDDVH